MTLSRGKGVVFKYYYFPGLKEKFQMKIQISVYQVERYKDGNTLLFNLKIKYHPSHSESFIISNSSVQNKFLIVFNTGGFWMRKIQNDTPGTEI